MVPFPGSISAGWRKYKNMASHNEKIPDMWNYQSREIEGWLENKGFQVTYGTDLQDAVCFALKMVTINSRQRSESRYYTLLHEAGHVLISQTASKFEAEHPMYACSSDRRVTKSKAYQVSLISEEIEAWKRGRRLANRFNHEIDNDKYDRIMATCVMSYIENAV